MKDPAYKEIKLRPRILEKAQTCAETILREEFNIPLED